MRSATARRRILLCVLISHATCTPDFDEVWQVKDLRILALRAERPEALVEASSLDDVNAGAIRVTALAADPRNPDRLYDWRVVACTAEERRCEDAALSKIVRTGRSRLDALRFDYPVDAELILAAIEADPFRGFGGVVILLELTIFDPEAETESAREIVAQRRLVFGLIDPPGKVENRNPGLTGISANGQPLPGGVGNVQSETDPSGDALRLALQSRIRRPRDSAFAIATPQELIFKRDRQVTLSPMPTADAKESYVVRTFDGGERTLEEFLSYSYFATIGKLSHARTGGKPSEFFDNKKVEDISSDWTTPTEAAVGQLWIVVRDDRGGVAWRGYDVRIR